MSPVLLGGVGGGSVAVEDVVGGVDVDGLGEGVAGNVSMFLYGMDISCTQHRSYSLYTAV